MTMSDGTTAVQVSPIPTESEMNSFRNMLDRALNAIVQASELAKVVEAVKTELDGLKHEIQTVRDNNRWLDEQLNRVRAERDEAKAQLGETLADLTSMTAQRIGLEQANGNQAALIGELRSRLDAAKAESDGWMQAAEKSGDELKVAMAKLANIQAFAKTAFGLQEPKPEPDVTYPVPTSPTTPAPTPEPSQEPNPPQGDPRW